ncbi:MAG TPA: hypothetical protein VGM79_16750 [Streptosporangiaceae bacterium]
MPVVVIEVAAAVREITTREVAASALTAGQLTAGQITACGVTGREVAAPPVTTCEVTGGEVTATEVTAGEVTATEVTAGEVTAGEVTASEVTGGEVTVRAGASRARQRGALAPGTPARRPVSPRDGSVRVLVAASAPAGAAHRRSGFVVQPKVPVSGAVIGSAAGAARLGGLVVEVVGVVGPQESHREKSDGEDQQQHCREGDRDLGHRTIQR